jgi:anti-sigma factor (TIGR02949 family)
MSCEHVGRDLDAYLDRELDAVSSNALRDHLGECAACRRQVAERAAIGRLVRAAPHYQVPTHLREKVLALAKRSRSVSAV